MGGLQAIGEKSSAEFRSAGRVVKVAPMMVNSPLSGRGLGGTFKGGDPGGSLYPSCGPFPKFHIISKVLQNFTASARTGFRILSAPVNGCTYLGTRKFS